MMGPFIYLPKPWRIWLEQNSILWQRLLIIPGVVLLSVFAALRFGNRESLLLIVLPFAIVGALALLRWPPLGLLILVSASIAFPEEIVWNIGITTIVTLGLMGLWILDMVARQQRLSFEFSPVYVPFIALIIISFIAFGMGQAPWYPLSAAPMDAQIGGILIFIVAFSVMLLVAHHVKDIRWLKIITYLFIGLAGVYVLGELVRPLGRFTDRIFPVIVPSHGMFWTWLVAMTFSMGIFNTKLARHWRGLLLGIGAMALYITLFQTRAWVSGWFPSLIALVVVVWVGSPKIAYVLSLVGVAGIATQMNAILENFLYVGDNAYSEVTRLEAWRIILEMVQVNPLFGLGPANYSFYTPLFPILGWFVQFNSHNNYVDMIAQTGYLGLICFLWLFWEVGKLSWRLMARVRHMDGFIRAYVYGSMGGFVATVAAAMLGDWVLPYVYNITIRGMRASMLAWLFFGGLIAIKHILDRQEQENETPVRKLF